MYENADDYGLVNSFDLLEVNRVLRFSPPITPDEFAAHVASYGRFSVESILACAASQDRPW